MLRMSARPPPLFSTTPMAEPTPLLNPPQLITLGPQAMLVQSSKVGSSLVATMFTHRVQLFPTTLLRAARLCHNQRPKPRDSINKSKHSTNDHRYH